MSKGAIDRGFARITSYMTFSGDLRQGNMDVETFTVPPRDVYGRRGDADYSKLGSDGLVPVGTHVACGDVIIGRILTRTQPKAKEPEFIRDRSIVLRKNEGGVVDAVLMTTNKDGMPSVRVKLRQTRIPEIGDKFSSRHGQKGTIGQVMAQVDLPFNREGITPDIIVNP
jgi:DNA-directed RNA polymerase beta subunit